MIDKEQLKDIYENITYTEKTLANNISKDFVTNSFCVLDPEDDYFENNYLLASKQVNKLKRLIPDKKIIDAIDIDWTGYKIIFNKQIIPISSTTELLTLIFNMFAELFANVTSENVVWNDNGDNRIIQNTLNWGDENHEAESTIQFNTNDRDLSGL